MKVQLLSLLIVLALASPVMAMSRMSETSGSEVLLGQAAPEFSLERSSGETQTLTQVRAGKKAILFFWATWCPHCHEELERVRQNLENIQKKGISLILVNVGESREEAKAYLQQNEIPLDTFIDEDNVVAGQYGVRGVPNMIFIDDKGIIRYRDYGLDSDYETKFQSK